MDFFDAIKRIIPSAVSNKITGLFFIQISSEFTSILDKYSLESIKVDGAKATKVIFHFANLTQKDKKRLELACKESFEFKKQFIENSKDALLRKLYHYNNDGDNAILDFFKSRNLISAQDCDVLRDSLFIRNEFKNNKKYVFDLKTDINNRYGVRGNIICNLCVAGYFESMIHMYIKDPTEFHKYWDNAVNKGIVALFVNGNMTVDAICAELKRRANFGVQYVDVHGIGDSNIRKINECIERNNEEIGIRFQINNKFYDEELHILVAQVVFVK